MTEKRLNVAETPIEELECDKKYVYDTGIIFECKNGCKFQILGEDVVRLLNEQDKKNIEVSTKYSQLEKENEKLKKELKNIESSFEFSCTENYTEFNKDKLIVKDTHTKIHLDDGKLFIEIYIPQINGFYRFKYTIIGKNLMREFIENYNPKGDMK